MMIERLSGHHKEKFIFLFCSKKKSYKSQMNLETHTQIYKNCSNLKLMFFFWFKMYIKHRIWSWKHSLHPKDASVFDR